MASADEIGPVIPATTEGQVDATVAAPTQSASPTAAPAPDPAPHSRIRKVFSGSRDLVRIAYRDPEHVSERLTLYTAARHGDPSREWAQSARAARPDVHRAKIADDLRTQSANIARIDGAIAGTPFFVALVPGYLTYLLQEMRMTLRTAALYDRDPTDLQTSAEMLALRGVHPNVEAAQAALLSVQDKGLPDRPTTRRSWRTWVHSAYLLLVFGGFMSPPDAEEDKGRHSKIKAAFGIAVGVAIWATTWILPVTFMVAMAWGCETHARQLGRRTLLYYDGEAGSVLDAIKLADQRQDHGHDKRAVFRAIALFLSVAVPIGFIAYVDHVRQTTGVNWLAALGALVALSLVIATAVISTRK